MLLTRTTYNASGEAFESLDPKGIVQRTQYDDAGRTIRTIQNYLPGSADPDANLTVEMTYNADGRQATLTAVNASTGNQTTRDEYGVSPATGSKLSSNDLLRETVYPDAGLDTVRYRYNRQGERIGMTDQNGTAHAYAYDQLGRMTADEVTALGTGIDGGVRKLGTTYEVRGLVEKLTSYNAANGVVNEVKNEYNGLAQLTKQFQSHAGAVTGGSPFVEYTYDLSASGGTFTKGARPTATIYPTSTQMRELDYGTAGEAGDKLARPVGITDGDTKRCNYDYLGFGTFMRVEYLSEDETVAFLTYELSSGNHYVGWDQYGRIVDHHWQKPLEDEEFETLDRFQYGYDANSNRLYKANLTARALDKPFDELYRYDQVNRLVDFERGTLNGAYTQIVGTPTKEQTWDLDPTGNWSRFTSADDGELETDQTRLSNPANEITELSSWFPPAYDHAGNMTKMPKPDAPAEGFVCTYDAWNRLVRVQEADECGCPAEIVSEYAYDPQTWRTVAVTYEDGEPDESRHFYYSSNWQILEERLESLLTPERTHLWGLRYIDEIAHRWRDEDEDGELDESIWAIQDANWNVTELYSAIESAIERYCYDAYGRRTALAVDYIMHSESVVDQQVAYCGYYLASPTHLYLGRARWTHPEIGEWCTRDDLLYFNGFSLYQFADNNPVTYLDPSGYLTIRPAPEGFSLGRIKCGDTASMSWDFLLDSGPKKTPGAPCEGYIVQKVTVTCSKTKCPIAGGAPQMETDSFIYYEAWKTAVGKRTSLLRKGGKGAKYTDKASFPVADGTEGSYKQDGEVRYYCLDRMKAKKANIDTGGQLKQTLDMRWNAFDPQVERLYGTPGICLTGPGSLPSIEDATNKGAGKTAPLYSFWNFEPEEGTATRTFSVDWKCCGKNPMERFGTAEASPK